MSEKKAKELRKIKAAQMHVSITLDEAGRMSITGMPMDPIFGMDLLGTATKLMAQRYLELRGQAQRKIMPVKTPILGADGRSLN